MAGTGKPTPGSDQTLGDLVALATKDMSQLVRYEIDLAKSELRGDLRRVAVGGALFGIAAFFGVGILFALLFGYAYLLHWVGVWGGMGGAFGFTAVTLALLMVIALLVAWRIIKRMSGMKRTRASVTEGIGMLRRDGDRKQLEPGRRRFRRKALDRDGKTETGQLADGQRAAELADRTPPG